MRSPLTRATLLKTAVVFAVWTAYGLLSAWETHYRWSFSKVPISWPESFRAELTYAYLWALASPVILWLAGRFRMERERWLRNLGIHAAAMIFFVIATKTVWEWSMSCPYSVFCHFTWPKLFRSIESSSDTGLLLYCVLILIEHSLAYYKRYQSGVVQASRLQMQLAQSQLQALKMQLHPHFLFNTLHTITELVHHDPEAAERTIARLSELLRQFLASTSIHEVTLREELRIIDLYFDIEKTRFEDRLTVCYEVPQELENATVPNLLLQPLVENAIRHGIGNRLAPGVIAISAERYESTLVLRVTDNGAGLNNSASREIHGGMGLTVTRGRLETLYGPHQSLVLRNLQSGGVEVRVVMPFRMTESTRGENAALQSIGG